MNKSILDFIAEDASKLQSRLGTSDVRKLDEYLTGVREIERRIERSESESDPETSEEVGYPVPQGIPGDYAEHIRLMSDIIVLAFQTDTTRDRIVHVR